MLTWPTWITCFGPFKGALCSFKEGIQTQNFSVLQHNNKNFYNELFWASVRESLITPRTLWFHFTAFHPTGASCWPLFSVVFRVFVAGRWVCVCVQYSVCVHGDKETTVCLTDVCQRSLEGEDSSGCDTNTKPARTNNHCESEHVEYHSEQLIEPDHHRRTHVYPLCEHENNDRWNVNKQD